VLDLRGVGALYLNGLDHFAKRTLHVRAYLRYMDDFSLFSDDASWLRDARAAIQEWLHYERRLALNPKRWSVVPTSEPSVFLGYRVSRAGLTPARKMRRRLAARVQHAARRGEASLIRTVRSYRGLVGLG